MKVLILFLLSLLLPLLGCTTIIIPYKDMKLPAKNIVFTFDDGPNEHTDVTLKVLSILKQYNIRAYFCVIGNQVVKNPEILKKIYEAGHIIANHSYHHDIKFFSSKEDTIKEIDMTDEVIGKVLNIENYHSTYIRPPMGVFTKTIRDVIHEKGMKPVNVSFFHFDSEYTTLNYKQVIRKTIQSLEQDQGGKLVLHDGGVRLFTPWEEDYSKPDKEVNRSWVPDALEEIIQHFSDLGYTFDIDG